ncbi:uncharacterized protein B0H18DRAFT_1004682 [Fomitopsis serialis]|uniref:uncharacterized protein n=1 Tax=Fomitopsis serialis TaxID=139415 RepID=UPI002007413F|nr:uncharacterized protein B0H18DRAFT_1004682 [Neoantrodia serialis]KAH9926951.1 hypothetical protein B0H18DRAFT_1004682 [Neoantrodia serialis]
MTSPAGLTSVRIAQLVGIGASGYLAGFMSSSSLVSIPPLSLAPPALAARQFATLYRTGARIAPATAVLAALAHLYLAYQSAAASPREGYAYLAAGVLTLSVVPYTLVSMMPTNKALLAVAESEGVGKDAAGDSADEARVVSLLWKWRGLNLVRSFGPAAGFLVGLLALGGYFA